MAVKPRFRPGANGTMTPRNNAARRQVLTRQYEQAGQVVSRGGIANAARRRSAGGAGG